MNLESITLDELVTAKENYRSEFNKLYSEISEHERKEFTERYNFLRSTLKYYRQIIHQKRLIELSQKELSRYKNSKILLLIGVLYTLFYVVISLNENPKYLFEVTIALVLIGLISYFIVFLLTLNLKISEEIVNLKDELLSRDLIAYQIDPIIYEEKQLEVYRAENFRSMSSEDHDKITLKQEILDFKIQLFLINFVRAGRFFYNRLL